MEKKFTHIDSKGQPSMVDVSDKKDSKRTAIASAIVVLNREIMALFDENDLMSKKGPVFQTAIIAGIQAAKKTGELIPLCHPLPLNNCKVEIKILGESKLQILCTATTVAKTGVEMEALTGASVAALTVYDMCKSFSKEILIENIRLIKKTGGKSDFLSD